MNDLSKKVEEANLTLGDFENAKRKLAAENAARYRIRSKSRRKQRAVSAKFASRQKLPAAALANR